MKAFVGALWSAFSGKHKRWIFAAAPVETTGCERKFAQYILAIAISKYRPDLCKRGNTLCEFWCRLTMCR
ncbi:MAG: hypothetical protein U0T32_14950 [Chitinophagales bacterium]